MKRIAVAPPVLVFGGPYSNLAATQAMRSVAEDLHIPPAHVICTGDVVAYCAEPEETTGLIREWGCNVVAGNCEEQLAAGAADCGCGFEEGTECDRLSKGWYPYAAARVSAASSAWMASLPAKIGFTLGGLEFCVLHGGVEETAKFLFASQKQALAAELASAGADVVIGGHAGLPFVEKIGSSRRPRAWFNAGVIGMPANDGTPDGWYGLIREIDGGVALETHRLRYDHTAAAAAMRKSGHANPYARALVTGLWPSVDILPEAERTRAGRRLREKRFVLPKHNAADAPAAA